MLRSGGVLLKNVGEYPKEESEGEGQHQEKSEWAHKEVPEEVAPGAEVPGQG
jgi:hypothetical protein